MAIVYQTPGTDSRVAGDQPLTPAYPTVTANDNLYLVYSHVTGATQAGATITPPGDWFPLFDDNPLTTQRLRVWQKRALGTETGTITVATANGNAATFHRAQIHRVTGAQPWVIESASLAFGTTSTVSNAGVTSPGAGRLAVNLGAIGSNVSFVEFTGETGGDWALSFYSGSSSARIYVQTAAIDAGTIDGGTALKGASGAWIGRGLVLRPAVVSAPRAFSFPADGGAMSLTAIRAYKQEGFMP